MTRRASFRTAAVVLGCFAAILLAEAGIRTWTWVRARQTLAASEFTAVSGSIYDPDTEFGYTYRPGAREWQVRIAAGRVVEAHPLIVNTAGNIGREPGPPRPGDYGIVVVGDSFTANPVQGITWTDHLAEHLPEVAGRRVHVRNLARDGYGMLQMIHMASAAAETLRPDLVVVAFIGQDLSRARFWRATLAGNPPGATRLVTLYRPPPYQDAFARDMALVDPRITSAWAAERSTTGDADALIASLTARYRQVAADQMPRPWLDRTRSLLRERILGRNPLAEPWPLAHLPGSRYADRMLTEDLARLRASGVPFLLLLLPTRQELIDRSIALSDQTQSLLQQLEQLSGQEAIPVVVTMRVDPARLPSLYLSETDAHPSAEGARAYGRGVADVLRVVLHDEATQR